MQKTTLIAITLFTLLTLPPAVLAGSMTYDIVNYPADQNGWTLSGTITTDGKIGDLAATDILSWSYTITTEQQGVPIAYTVESSEEGTSVGTSGLEATNTELTLPNGEAIGFFGEVMLGYQRFPGPFGIAYVGYLNEGGLPELLWSSTPTQLGVEPGTWVIASVPEPSTLYLLGFGAVCGSVFVMGHKRRERRTGTTA
ncbi:MAG: PEP-CTERM sorting domain-containing protein [Isosphaeraceae bacterium]